MFAIWKESAGPRHLSCRAARVAGLVAIAGSAVLIIDSTRNAHEPSVRAAVVSPPANTSIRAMQPSTVISPILAITPHVALAKGGMRRVNIAVMKPIYTVATSLSPSHDFTIGASSSGVTTKLTFCFFIHATTSWSIGASPVTSL